MHRIGCNVVTAVVQNQIIMAKEDYFITVTRQPESGPSSSRLHRRHVSKQHANQWLLRQMMNIATRCLNGKIVRLIQDNRFACCVACTEARKKNEQQRSALIAHLVFSEPEGEGGLLT